MKSKKRKIGKSKIKGRQTIWDLFIDPKMGMVFMTDSIHCKPRYYAYKYYHDASGAITDIVLEEVEL